MSDAQQLAEALSTFRRDFARRQAARVVEAAGGFAVLDEEFSGSYEHNQLYVERADDPAALAGLADELLGGLRHRRIAVRDGALAEAAAPALLAAGYTHDVELLMVHRGPLPAGAGRVDEVGIAELRPAELEQWRRWLPDSPDAVLEQLVGRRKRRLDGADSVRTLAARDEDGEIGAWADLYVDRASGLAQIEDLATAEPRRGRGLGDAVLAAALHRAAAAPGHRLTFLVADAADWPQHWYARRGFTPIGRTHAFTRS
ncbi:GNAT family N-acetyltransferase [Kitasatospora sp. NPDC048365]|uniref:GNAT family N-acetyltransferase n=1 Tax=Kitasatospora sp. NPDC048365 TaxID=3364050 RepID=UPI0037239C41